MTKRTNGARRFRVAIALSFSALGFAAIGLAAPEVSPPPPPQDASAAPPPTAEQIAAGKRAFVDVARVLQSPRCMNCHPVGDAPLRGDNAMPHLMNVSRIGLDAGLACATCHRDRNSDEIGVKNGPPGAPNWQLPPVDMPMVFQGKTVTALCEQLKDPARNNHRDFNALLEHVDKDPLVLWGWHPGAKRTLPPLTHTEFVAAFTAWAASNGACP